ncbi:MAG: TolC family outer membrane protein [Caulobacterales bacterium]|jgi:outer membrane protein|nr:TolC family outer membrane protein [Caulobacterales bacterium]
MRRLLPLLALGLLTPGAALADTVEDAMAAAHRNNPNLEDARLAVRAAREGRVQAAANYLPTLGVTGTYGAQELMTETESIFGPSTREAELNPATTNVDLTQRLYTGGRRGGQSRLARAEHETARHQYRATEQDILLFAVEAYLSVRRDSEILRLREDHVVGLESQLSGTQRRLQVGEVSRTDVAQAETRLAGARAALSRARAELERSRARYEEIVGQPPEALEPISTPPETPTSLEDALRIAETTHPQILAARSSERAARARVTIERAALLPQLSVTGRFETAEDSNAENDYRESSSAVATVSVPLFEGGLAWSRTRQSRINVDRAEARTEAQRREIIAEVTRSWNGLVAGRDVLAAAQQQVDASDMAVRGAERERGLGLRSTLDVLNAQEEARETLIGRARAEAEATFASYALLASTGQLTLPATREAQ